MAMSLHASMPQWPRPVRIFSYVSFPLGQTEVRPPDHGRRRANFDSIESIHRVRFPNLDPPSRLRIGEVLAVGSCGASVEHPTMTKNPWSSMNLSGSLNELRSWRSECI